jgi:Uma2 family endonuclease
MIMATVIEESVPPLSAGDKLTRAEFLRRWEADPEIKKAELIGGMVYMPSPVSIEHGDMDGEVGGWVYTYKVATPGTACGHNTTTFLQEDTPQPGVNLRILPEYGGKSFVRKNYLEGIPELLAEICRSSATYDLNVKLELYQAAKVPEYLTILLYEREVRWHILEGANYRILTPDADSLLRSQVFPGLWLDVNSLLAGNTHQVLVRLQEGLQSAEHERFVAELGVSKEC